MLKLHDISGQHFENCKFCRSKPPILNFIVTVSNTAVPMSESVTLIGGVSDVGSVYNEALSLEHWGETVVTCQRGKLI